MSWSLKLAVVGLVFLASQGSASQCAKHIKDLKNNPGKAAFDVDACPSLVGKFDDHIDHVHSLINEHIGQSFLYSLMASHFATDAVNRHGFSKYMGDLADSMWTDAIELIKYVGTRGTGMTPVTDPTKKHKTGLRISNLPTSESVAWTEMEALATALDRHNALATKVHNLHALSKDAALTGYLEKEFTAKHADKVREISGLLTNLVPMVLETAGRDLALYFFDQKLLG